MRALRFREFNQNLRESGSRRSETRDGVGIELMANVDLPAEAALARRVWSEGIGLYRTEFLFLNRREPPSEQEQYQVYARSCARRCLTRSPCARSTWAARHSRAASRRRRFPTPRSGLRAIRLALARPELLGAQLRAVLRAAAHGPLRLMFPLVSGLKELRQARAALDLARQELAERGEVVGNPEVGVMIELPSAVMMADRFAQECDFLSVGTNDLVQYGLAVDRSNPEVAYLAQSLDPAVLRMLEMVVRAANAHGKPLSMCGDMAADAFVLPIVVGLGYRQLSVPVIALPLVREVLRRIDAVLARTVATHALACATADEVVWLVATHFGRELGDLWTEAGIEQPS